MVIAGPTFTQAINNASDELSQVIDSGSLPENRQAALHTWTWTSKALILRGACEEALWTAKVVSPYLVYLLYYYFTHFLIYLPTY